ncbi:MAG: hypothetical protein OEY43_08885 [Gammaproteobacteria bacterium]|nr:hypothetical protein [Gammaproteobacteria bacterium]
MPKHILHYLYLLLWPLIVNLLYVNHAHSESYEISPGLYHFNYSEYSTSDKLLDKETGFLPGIKLAIDYAHNKHRLNLNFALYDATIDYDGQTQSGQPHTTNTKTRIIKWGMDFFPNQADYIPGQFFLGINNWQWDRDILTRDNILGLHEVYYWAELHLGIRFESEKINEKIFWTELSVLYISNPKMAIYLSNSKESLYMDDEPGFRVRVGTKKHITANLDLGVSVHTEYWAFGRSDTIFVSDFFGSPAGLTEPRSESLHSGIEINLYYNF